MASSKMESTLKDSANLKKAAEEALQKATTEIRKRLDADRSLRRSFLRLAFYDAILHNPIGKVDRPKGSIRFLRNEKDQVALDAIDELEKLRNENANVKAYVSYADLYQLAGILAIKSMTDMDIDIRFNRLDSSLPVPLDELAEFMRVQRGEDVGKIRAIFSHLGFDDKEVVALYSAIILYGVNPSLFNTDSNLQQVNLWTIYEKLIADYKPKRGRTSTKIIVETSNPPSSTVSTSVDVVQFQTTTDSLKAWEFLVVDPSFCKHVELFAKDHAEFSKTYKAAHQKLSNLGFQNLSPMEAIAYHDIKHGIALGLAMTIIFGFLGFFYETMRS